MQTHRFAVEDAVIAVIEIDVRSLLQNCIRLLPVTYDDVDLCVERELLLRKVVAWVESGKWPKVDPRFSPFNNRKETMCVVDPKFFQQLWKNDYFFCDETFPENAHCLFSVAQG